MSRRAITDALARDSNRRGFLERLGGAVIALAGARTLASAALPADAEAYTNFCGHTYTTGNCPAPTGLPRIDAGGYPLRAADGVPVDDLGRPVNAKGRPIDSHGQPLRDADGVPLAPAPRSRVCEAAGHDYDITLHLDGSWYRCCGGTVRQIRDCCGVTDVRINGDAALVGYCYPGHHVFCVTYFETSMPC